MSAWTTAGLALYATAAGRCDARAVIRETGTSIMPAHFDDHVAPMSGTARRLLDTSWHNSLAFAPGASGLNARVYHLGTAATQAKPPVLQSIENEINVAQTQSPSYTFVTTNAPTTGQGIVFSGGDTTPTNTFLGAYAAGAASVDTAPWATSIIDLQGYLNFPTAGTYQFNLISADDAAAIFLGGNAAAGSGTLLQAKNFDSSIPSAPGLPNPLHIDIFPVNGVAQTGWYPFEAILYNQYTNGAGGAGLNWQVSGPGIVQFSTYAATPQPPVPGPNPLHQYAFNSAGVIDSAPADQSNGALIGGATVADGALVTSGASNTQAAQLGDMSFFSGSFSLGHWFTLNDHAPSYQTLFCFGADNQNYLVGHPQLGDDGGISVEYALQGISTLLRAPLPALGAPIKLFTTYEGTTQQVNLYVNDQVADTQTLPFAFNLASIATNYKNVGGVSPWGDPSLSGSTDQFNVYREAVSLQQIIDTQPA